MRDVPPASAGGKPIPTERDTVTRIAFLDLETTSLRPGRRAWEVGLIVRDPGVGDAETHWLVDSSDLDLGNADPAALKIGRFYERHPDFDGSDPDPFGPGTTWPEARVMDDLERETRGAIVVGVAVHFDTETLDARMRAHGICPSWSHRILDARTFAAGALRMAPPLDFDAILSAFGVSCPPEDRHTALGDAKLARDLYDAVMAR